MRAHRKQKRDRDSSSPIGAFNNEQLDGIHPLALQYSSLDEAIPCNFCGARLFAEEKSRSKWCCGQGELFFPKAPPLTASFYTNPGFLKNARLYNNLFSFSALGVTGEFVKAPGGYGTSMVKIQGKVYHRLFDLSWQQEGGVNNSQLYIDDGSMRMAVAKRKEADPKMVSEINTFLQEVNPLCPVFKQLGTHPSDTAHIVFEKTSRTTHGPVLGDQPRCPEIAAILKNDAGGTQQAPRKVTVWKVNDRAPQFVNILDPTYEPLQYPVIFPHASSGWFPGMLSKSKEKISQTKYYRQLFLCEDDRLRRLGRLGQEYAVDAYSRLDQEKLNYIRYNQEKLMRIGTRQELDETISAEGGRKVGMVYLPSSYTGGPRYMMLQYQNAMAVVARRGKPSFFTTITCNPKWKEIQDNLLPGQYASDRPDLCNRVFHEKVAMAIRMIKDGRMFGKMVTILDVVEFQKRGLPHVHIALRVSGGGPVQVDEIDKFIRATIPDEKEANGRLRKLVLEHMVHGPCGATNPSSPCMDHSGKIPKCTKEYPKPFSDVTHIDERGYVHYRRPEGPSVIKTKRSTQYTVQNCDIVPYCPALLLLMECHCNVEISTSVHIIKYLYKYLHKGPDRAKVAVATDENVDEIKNWETVRYVSAAEALWRIFEYALCGQYPSVIVLPIHLPRQDKIVFQQGKEQEALDKSASKLLLYIHRPRCSQLDDLTYLEFYEQYSITTTKPKRESRIVFELHTGKHYCARREREDAVARMHWISPSLNELFYLRVLLGKVPAHSFEELLSHDNITYGTFQEAAQARGLVIDEKEYSEAIVEASTFKTGSGMRQLLVCLIVCGAPAKLLWDQFRHLFAEDFLDIEQDENKAYNSALCCLDRKLRLHGKELEEVGLPKATDDSTELGREQMRWDREKLKAFVEEWLPKFTHEQRAAYEYVIDKIQNGGSNDPIFIDGPSGTGKTLLLNVIAAKTRSIGKVALCAAATGNASLNYDGGMTAHSLLKIPVDTSNPNAVCEMSAGSQRVKLIEAAAVIIWDEAPMSNRHNAETVDRTFQDFFEKTLFGGKLMAFSGDDKQIGPVVRNGRKLDVIRVSLKSSPIWENVIRFPLTAPQRDREDPEYSQFVLEVGEDRRPKVNIETDDGSRDLIALEMVQTVDSIDELIDFVYDDLSNEESCASKAILSGTNVNIDALNKRVLDRIPGDPIQLLSADSCIIDNADECNNALPTEVLHTISEPGVPDHNLTVKPGAVCIVTRNLSFDDALVNGSKVIIRKASTRLIEADIIRRGFERKKVFIPRINFVFNPGNSPVKILRRQFPLRLAYSLTFNKSQGQTLDKVGLDLRSDAFAHGQLYVALGRVRNRNSIRVLVSEERKVGDIAITTNVVYKELLA